jgi:phosphatidylglycerophosphate synthase
VARLGEKTSPLGAFLDSVVDRYSDFLIFGGLLAHYAAKGALGLTLLILVIICGMFMTSYARARAEGMIPRCDVGLLERPERILLLAAGSLFDLMLLFLIVLAVGVHVTALHRILFTIRNVKKQQETGDS